VLAPGHAADAVQFIDVRDLARFMLDALETGRQGVFNATSPPGLWSIGQLLRACALAADCSPRWVWADAATLEELGLKPWSDLPVWLPLEGEHAGMPFTSTHAAQAVGLRCRELIDTVQDTLDWWRGLPAELQEPTRAGLSAQREAAALQAIALRPPKTEDEDGDVD
jgi:2'-hydroxyisoflavone reductase